MAASLQRTYVDPDDAEIETRNALKRELVVYFAGAPQDQHIPALESEEMSIGRLYGMMSNRGPNENSHYRYEVNTYLLQHITTIMGLHKSKECV